jgi:hypothetical protein
MNIIYNKISLDIHNIASQLTLAVKKGDTARGLIITLTDNGKVYNIPDYCYATFSAKKSDGTFVSSGCEIKDNKIIYDFSPQLTKVPGRVDCEASLFSKDEAQITSPLFTLYVYRTIRDEYEDEITSSDEFKTLDKLVSETTEVLAETKEVLAESKVATSAAKESVTYIEATADGRIKLLDFNKEEIITVDVFCGDDDTLYRYSDGMLSVVGIKERNKDRTFRMWVGTNEEYLELAEKDAHTFYWITDDMTFDDVVNAINALNESFTELEKRMLDGEFKADCTMIHTINGIRDLDDYLYFYQKYAQQSISIAINTSITLETAKGDVVIPALSLGTLTLSHQGDASMHLIAQTGEVFHLFYEKRQNTWINSFPSANEVNLSPYSQNNTQDTVIHSTGLYCISILERDTLSTCLISVKNLNQRVHSTQSGSGASVYYDGNGYGNLQVYGSREDDASIVNVIRLMQYDYLM